MDSVTNAPGHGGDAALWSGNVSPTWTPARSPQVTVPTSNATLTFDELHQAEDDATTTPTRWSRPTAARPTPPLANENTVDGPYGPALNGDAEVGRRRRSI